MEVFTHTQIGTSSQLDISTERGLSMPKMVRASVRMLSMMFRKTHRLASGTSLCFFAGMVERNFFNRPGSVTYTNSIGSHPGSGATPLFIQRSASLAGSPLNETVLPMFCCFLALVTGIIYTAALARWSRAREVRACVCLGDDDMMKSANRIQAC